ncbi:MULTISPECIES: beta strand repeat-containing protein [unclassified Sphingomonas]|jgi:Ca2+-binding RTX toxin-like protein|uniref:beta strand repeat-containing protein n=1 Tax=unclassified Sphingomonas TaxID=196159 RepID=UPI000830C796|nr:MULTISPECIES: calcium-binding protein [unclassified Sphingomonas]
MATFIGTAGDDNIVGTAENNTIIGNAGNDTLDGAAGDDSIDGGAGTDTLIGGTGNDTLNGGADNDTYTVADAGDVIVESSTGGANDVVNASVSYVLNSGAWVETLNLTGTGNNFVIGNQFAQTLNGNAGNNVLDGGRNTAQPTLGDTLVGGAGDDVYAIRNPGDVVTELAGGGTDIVYIDADALQAAGQAIATYALTAGTAVETLSAANQSGTQALVLTGNALDQTVVGNFGANTLSGGGGNDTLIGLGGNDTYVLGAGTITFVEAADGGTDTITFAAGAAATFTLNADASIEVITASNGVNVITGNNLSQRINGAAGAVGVAETLSGGTAGADTLAGAGGGDTYLVNSTDDVIIETGFEADGVTATADVVQFTATTGGYALAEGVNVDSLTATAATGNVVLVGNALTQTLTGNAGNNVLNGGTSATGTGDTLVGGAGNDTYRVYTALDVVTEAVGEGTDSVFTSASYTLSANVENLSAADQGATTGEYVLTGNDLANQIVGNFANNTLVGGLGVDTLTGLGGNDAYVVNGADVISEAVGGGTDSITFATEAGFVAYTLTAGAEVETITLGGNVVSVTGNALAQRINGATGNVAETLIGGGGADTLAGGAGNDAYTVDSTDDVIIETGLAADGVTATTDTVTFTATTGGYALADGVAIDSLTATGTGNVFLVGNSGAQTLTGNSGNNILNGAGVAGGGGDTLVGGAGDDIYRVFSSSDVVTELANEGNDTVFASVNYTLGTNVESLVAADATAVDNLVLQGNAANNTIAGNFGRNVLSGGDGIDNLFGLSGADTFHFAATGVGNADNVLDFSSAEGDRISLDQGVFAFGGPTLTAAQFVIGVSATAASAQILYDQATGRLFYDADGTGAGAAVIFATLVPGTALTNNDIVITAAATIPTP